jgi:hypothetical protein
MLVFRDPNVAGGCVFADPSETQSLVSASVSIPGVIFRNPDLDGGCILASPTAIDFPFLARAARNGLIFRNPALPEGCIFADPSLPTSPVSRGGTGVGWKNPQTKAIEEEQILLEGLSLILMELM